MADRLRAILAAAVCAAACAPAAASAADTQVTHTYRFAFAGRAHYDQTKATEAGDHTETENASFAVAVRGRLEFLDGLLVRTTLLHAVTLSDGRSSRVTWTDGGTGKTCDGTSALTTQHALVYPTRAARAAPETHVSFVPFAVAELFMACNDTDGGVFDETLTLTNRPVFGGARGAKQFGPYDTVFVVPPSEVGKSRLRLQVREQRSNAPDCPGRDYYTRTCATSLTGSLVLELDDTSERRRDERRDGRRRDDDLLAPPPAVDRRARLEPRARAVRVRAKCLRGCKLYIPIFEAPRRGRGRIRGRASFAGSLIAVKRARLRPSRAFQTVTVPLGPAARRAVQRSGAVRIELVVDPPAGRSVHASLFAQLP